MFQRPFFIGASVQEYIGYTPGYFINRNESRPFTVFSGSSQTGSSTPITLSNSIGIAFTHSVFSGSGKYEITSVTPNSTTSVDVNLQSVLRNTSTAYNVVGPVSGSLGFLQIGNTTANTVVYYGSEYGASVTSKDLATGVYGGGTLFVVLVTANTPIITCGGANGSCTASTASGQYPVIYEHEDRMDNNWRLIEHFVVGESTFAAFAYYRAEEIASDDQPPINLGFGASCNFASHLYQFYTPEYAVDGEWIARDCVPAPSWTFDDTGWVKVNDGFAPDNNCWLDNVAVGLNALDGVPAVYDPQGAFNRDFNGTAYSTSINSMIPSNAIITNIQVRATLRRGNSNTFSRSRLGASTGSSGSYTNVGAPGASYAEYSASGLFGIDRAAIASGNLGVYFEYRMASGRLAKLDIDFAEIKVEYRYPEE